MINKMKLTGIVIISAVIILTLHACGGKYGTVHVNRNSIITVPYNATAANESFDVSYVVSMKSIKSMVAKKATDLVVTNIKLINVTLTFNDSIGASFEDIENAQLSIGDKLIGALPSGVAGKSFIFEIPVEIQKENFEKYYTEVKDITLTFKSKARNSFPKGSMNADVLLDLEGVLLY